MTKYACPKCTMKRTMTLERDLSVYGLQLVYSCYKCGGVWIFRENPSILNELKGVVVTKGRTKGPRFRTSSK